MSGTATTRHGLGVIIMAAGLGKRMQSKMGKVLHPVVGKPMVLYAVDLATRVGDAGIAVVVGHQGERVRALIGGYATPVPVQTVEQTKQLGTGHAVKQARSVFDGGAGPAPAAYLILNGDTPLLTANTIDRLLETHRRDAATVTILTARLPNPAGYGRVVRAQGAAAAEHAAVLKIVEDKDTTPDEAALNEINVGTYVVDGAFLFQALDRLRPNNAQGEYYLTDILAMAVAEGKRVSASTLADAAEGLGVNTRAHLAEAEAGIRDRIRRRWLDAGVTMKDPSSTWIDAEVTIGRDTVLHPHVTLEGRTTVGEDCVIRSHVRLTDCTIQRGVEILDSCVLREATVEDESDIGPFTHLRPGSIVRSHGKVGNFVEMKKTELGEGAKANHLTYLGDATIGKGVNIGAGTITCNYDGVNKFKTVVEDDVFIGSDSQLVAPVRIGRGALIAAGTTVTQDVPAGALVIARTPQAVRPGWAAKRRAAAEAEKAGKAGKSSPKSSPATAATKAAPVKPSAKPSSRSTGSTGSKTTSAKKPPARKTKVKVIAARAGSRTITRRS
ncbi:MAG: bifunctional UDP-N-acetylglucosamine diphosphorylase/glucosamine-1-phosphate N-acetyltransferase GlmU [Nitrospiraceae bacterium]